MTKPFPSNFSWIESPLPLPMSVLKEISVAMLVLRFPDHAIVALGSVKTGVFGVTFSVSGS